MSRFCVWTLAHEGYQHSRAFDELSLSVACSLEELGHDVRQYYGDNQVRALYRHLDDPKRYRPIVLGAHLAHSWGVTIPDAAIIYNTEQQGSSWMTPEYLDLLARHRVWNTFTGRGHTVRPGYHPCLEQIDRTGPRPIDVAFVGSMNERRQRVIKEIQDLGLVVDFRFNCYGEERDRLYSQCKLAINMHFYENAEHESVRTSYLMANRIPVLTEFGLGGLGGMTVRNEANLALQAKVMIDRPAQLEAQALAGYEFIRRRPMVLEVDRAL
jgi:hypothetical protein